MCVCVGGGRGADRKENEDCYSFFLSLYVCNFFPLYVYVHHFRLQICIVPTLMSQHLRKLQFSGIFQYRLTCLLKSPKGDRKGDHCRQVTFCDKFYNINFSLSLSLSRETKYIATIVGGLYIESLPRRQVWLYMFFYKYICKILVKISEHYSVNKAVSLSGCNDIRYTRGEESK